MLHYPPLDLTVPAVQKRSVVDRPMLRPWMGEYHEVAGADHAYDLADDVRARATYTRIADHVRQATASRN